MLFDRAAKGKKSKELKGELKDLKKSLLNAGGNLVNDGRKVMMQAGLRYQLLYPTLILSFVTIAFYLIGNAFSDAADPKNHLQ
jgi:hypothetical protein